MSAGDPTDGTWAADPRGASGADPLDLFGDLSPLVPDDPDAALVADAEDSDPQEDAPLPADPRGTADLARVYAALLARAGETLVEKRLDATLRACELLGDVHRAAPVVTVTGTNGKTSTARMVDALLTAHGLRVGRFTSPHLHRVTERIALDGAEVSERTFVRVYDEIAPVLEVVDRQLADEDRAPLTFFEALTVLAFAVFADAPVDVYVVEVGMGGEWDSTNVADAQVCGFTPVGYDHQAFLGDTLTEIAATKAGILDRTQDDTPAPRPLAVIGVQEPEAQEELDAQCARRGVRSFTAGREFGVLERSRAVDGQLVTVRGLLGDYPDLFLPLHGAHQADNLAQALALVESFLADEDRMLAREEPLDAEVLGQALETITSPGRAEILRSEPTVLVDGAHNPAGAAVLADTLAEAFEFRQVVAVVAMFADKDPHGVFEHVHRFADRVVVTQTVSPRAMSVEDLADAATDWWDRDDVVQAPDMNEALMGAIDIALEDGDPGYGIVVTGSVTTVAEARTLLGKKGTA
ncbi:bifunctional folylpolyglutamate synthase/dihydrofolate synthase [Brevibacterium litoralis]|uniref:bifunctional folylpolyglutamate synthase/dihydrofolate synthase n=1 Tax=Brevibacterium litoralis TaxID=3138935 RepID=UPI0032EBE91D